MKTLRLRDTQHLAARNSTAEVTAVISTLRAGRDPGGWLGTPVTRQAGLGAEKALHTQDPEGRCPGHSPGGHAHRLMSQDRPQERKHGHTWALRSPARRTRRSTTACLGDAPACVAEAARHLRAPRPMPRSAHTNHRSPRKERACPSPRPPPGDTSTRETPPHRTAGLLGTAGELCSQPFGGTATRGGRTGTCRSQAPARTPRPACREHRRAEAPLRPRSQTPELPAARRRVRGQLVSCWFRLLELGNCAAAVTESGGPWDECAWR